MIWCLQEVDNLEPILTNPELVTVPDPEIGRVRGNNYKCYIVVVRI